MITVEAFEDIALEQALFDAKTSYFENVYIAAFFKNYKCVK